jgi:SAM-dependent methyltransferase
VTSDVDQAGRRIEDQGRRRLGPLGSWEQSANRAGIDLFVASFLVLFFELTCIRWFGATVIFLTFFTNLVLMASFLGVSVGCLAASRRWNLIRGFSLVAALAVALAYGALWGYARFNQVVVDVGSQQSPQLIYFGTDARVRDISTFVVPIEVVGGVFFVLIAVMFIGLGQEIGRRFDAIPNRVAAYTADILGSLTGILAFGVSSFLQLPALVWFAVTLATSLLFVTGWKWRWAHLLASAAALFVVAKTDYPRSPEGTTVLNTWSPYYLVSYKPSAGWIDVNNLNHQGMHEIGKSGSAYMLPYLLNRDAGGRSFEEILIIGAGSGNDVAAALKSNPRHIDAVEIDPVINAIGQRDHPDQPFSDPRVSIHLDDGRSFVRRSEKQYDLIVYALVDSLVLHSSYSSLRLESFLFTEQAFREIKARLRPGGVFALYNFYRQGWVVGRLEKLVETVFGSRPIVVSLPYQETISPSNNQRGFITFLLVGNAGSPVIANIRSKLEAQSFFWLNPEPRFNESINGYGPDPPPLEREVQTAPEFKKIGLARVDATGISRIPTDQWPFLYLREASIPSLNLRGMAIVAVFSLLILLIFAPVRRVRPNGQMFFLGAGFMLLETKGVVHMALLFGATWMVNSIVFAAILCMILLSNFVVLHQRPRRLWPYYVLLMLVLAINSLIPMAGFLDLPGAAKVVASCAVVFIPVFFAGIIFATSFRDSLQPDIDFGSNIGGIILGGLSEYFSLLGGFNSLLWIAIGYYLLSALLRPGGIKPREN